MDGYEVMKIEGVSVRLFNNYKLSSLHNAHNISLASIILEFAQRFLRFFYFRIETGGTGLNTIEQDYV
mgnify:CR=1 FL=1